MTSPKGKSIRRLFPFRGAGTIEASAAEKPLASIGEIIWIQPNNASTASRHPGTAGSACAVSPSLNVTGLSGSLAR